MLAVERVHVGDMQMNCYLVTEPQSGETMIVDPGDDAPKIERTLGDRKPVGVLLTHAHFDHMGAADALCARYAIPLYVHELDAYKLADPDTNMSRLFGAPMTVATKPVTFGDDGVLSIGGERLTVMHTPGHSVGSCCFLLPDSAGVLCGDTLFNRGYGRVDFPDGDFNAIRDSLRRLWHLSPKMPAYPGHGDMTTAGRDEAKA